MRLHMRLRVEIGLVVEQGDEDDAADDRVASRGRHAMAPARRDKVGAWGMGLSLKGLGQATKYHTNSWICGTMKLSHKGQA